MFQRNKSRKAGPFWKCEGNRCRSILRLQTAYDSVSKRGTRKARTKGSHLRKKTVRRGLYEQRDKKRQTVFHIEENRKENVLSLQ